MITAIDTNVLLDILVPDDRFLDQSSRALQDAATEGSLVISDPVYAELCVHFDKQSECDRFLEDNDIRTEALSRPASFMASRAWRTYRHRGGKRTRILADFLIGAHAQLHASRLLTRYRGFYNSMFPSLRLLDPTEQSASG